MLEQPVQYQNTQRKTAEGHHRAHRQTREQQLGEYLALGANAYVTKPFSTKDLVAKVKEMLAA